MKTQQTSLLAYLALDDLSTRQRQVYAWLQNRGPMSNLDLSEKIGKPINSITPRTNELVVKGLVEEAYKAPSKQTGRTVIYWRVV